MNDQYPSNVEVHRWAQAQPWGHKVPMRNWRAGAVGRQIIAAWDKAHPDRPYVRSEAYHGTPSGYTKRDCRCERCTAAAADEKRERRRAADFERDGEAAS